MSSCGGDLVALTGDEAAPALIIGCFVLLDGHDVVVDGLAVLMLEIGAIVWTMSVSISSFHFRTNIYYTIKIKMADVLWLIFSLVCIECQIFVFAKTGDVQLIRGVEVKCKLICIKLF